MPLQTSELSEENLDPVDYQLLLENNPELLVNRIMPTRRTYGRPSRYSSGGRVRVLQNWRQRNRATRAAQYAVARTQGPNRISNVRSLRGAGGFPRQMLMKHKFVEITKQEVGGTLNIINVSALAMFKPSGTSHNPMYYNNMIALYKHYVVLGSKIVVECRIDEADPNSAVRFAIFRNDDATTTFTKTQEMIEQPSGNGVVATATDTFPKKLYGSYSARKMFGENPVSNSQLKGNHVAHPAESVYFSIGTQRDEPLEANLRISMTITVEYTAVWFEPGDQARNT